MGGAWKESGGTVGGTQGTLRCGEASGYRSGENGADGGHQLPLAFSVNSRMGLDSRNCSFIFGSVRVPAIS